MYYYYKVKMKYYLLKYLKHYEILRYVKSQNITNASNYGVLHVIEFRKVVKYYAVKLQNITNCKITKLCIS